MALHSFSMALIFQNLNKASGFHGLMGKLVAFEGIDSSGKATQMRLLRENLTALGYSAATFDFPQYDKEYGKKIADYLKGKLGDFRKTDPYDIAELYALDRLSSRQEIRDALDSYDVVLINRYVSSNIAYPCARIEDPKEKEKFREWMLKLEYITHEMPHEDLVVFLDVPVRISFSLRKSRGQISHGDVHEKDARYQESVAKEYLKLAKQPHWVRVICTKDSVLLREQEIAEKVLQEVKRIL